MASTLQALVTFFFQAAASMATPVVSYLGHDGQEKHLELGELHAECLLQTCAQHPLEDQKRARAAGTEPGVPESPRGFGEQYAVLRALSGEKKEEEPSWRCPS